MNSPALPSRAASRRIRPSKKKGGRDLGLMALDRTLLQQGLRKRRRDRASRILNVEELPGRKPVAPRANPASPAFANSLQLHPSLLREFHGFNQHEHLGNEERKHHGGRHRRRRGQEFDIS
jgi:hypothetical protein